MTSHLLRIVIFSFLLCTLTGCWDRLEINDMAIITAAGIDLVEDEHIKLSVQVIIPKSLMGGEGGPATASGKSTFVRSAVGVNLADAISKLQMHLPRKIFFGHCKAFIFGEKLAKHGIQESLDYLLRSPDVRGGALTFISQVEPEKILSLVPPLESYSADVLEKSSRFKILIEVSLFELNLRFIEEAQTAAVPIVKILPPVNGNKAEETIPVIVSTAILRKDKMIDTVNLYETRGLMWLMNEVKEHTITVKVDDEEISINPKEAHVKLIPKIENDRWSMNVKISTIGDINQNGTEYSMTDPILIADLEKEFGEQVQERIEHSFKIIQEDLNVDIVGFARKFHEKYPKEWEKAKKHWEDIYPKIEVQIEVDADIRRSGYFGKPAGIPIDEVKNK